MKRHMGQFQVYREADGWYVRRTGWPIEVQMWRYSTRKKALNGLHAFQREQFGPWCLPEGMGDRNDADA